MFTRISMIINGCFGSNHIVIVSVSDVLLYSRRFLVHVISKPLNSSFDFVECGLDHRVRMLRSVVNVEGLNLKIFNFKRI